MIDTHTHLNLIPLLSDYKQVWSRAQAIGVTKAITVGVDLESSVAAVKIATELPGIFATVGIHPETKNQQPEQLESIAKNQKVVAIGECGLDYTNTTLTKLTKNEQKQLFGAQIQLAKKLKLPLSIHCRDTKESNSAYHDLIDTLEHFSMDGGITPKFVLHCMSGDQDYLQKAIKLGGYISFAGNVTYPSAGNLRELLRSTPHERLLLETDAPFLSPQGKRGTTNESANIKDTFAFVASELRVTFEELDGLTTRNAGNLFQFKI